MGDEVEGLFVREQFRHKDSCPLQKINVERFFEFHHMLCWDRKGKIREFFILKSVQEFF